jgi:hypothetical protein
MPAAPSAAQLAVMMKVIDRHHVCLSDTSPSGSTGRCLLIFAKKKAAWRLVGMQATDLKIRVGAQP